MPRAQPFPPARIPKFGFIEGGVLDGWAFAFRTIDGAGRAPVIEVTVTRPQWPFPHHTPVGLRRRDFTKLRNPGETAPYIDSQKWLEAACSAEA